MGIFSNIEQETVFKSEEALQAEFLPQALMHREGQIAQIANCIKPALSGKKPYNVFVSGPPGVGKTAVIKFIFRELEEYERVEAVYLNCWEYNTRHAVLGSVLTSLGGFAPRRGVATDEVFDKLMSFIKGSEKTVIIALDEIDQLLRNDGSQVLYDLSRSAGAKAGIVAITNDMYVGRFLDARVKSSLAQENLSFMPYSEREVLDILSERAKLAFRPGKQEPGLVPRVAKFVGGRGGDLRLGLECLWKAGRLADEKGTIVRKEYLEEIFGRASQPNVGEALSRLSGMHRKLLRLMGTDGVLSGELFEKVAKDISERSFRNYVADLEAMKLVEATATGAGFRGKSRLLRCRVPLNMLEASPPEK